MYIVRTPFAFYFSAFTQAEGRHAACVRSVLGKGSGQLGWKTFFR